jgi:hypothetical protein
MQLLDYAVDALPGWFGDTGLIVENSGDGLDRDLSVAGNIRDGRSP